MFTGVPGLHVVGVRHHSPACARVVAHAVRTLRPRQVLIEGPVDMNDRIDELLLGHQLPIAVFSTYRGEGRHHASWTPLCEYSPEWVALQEGRAAGARVRFMDLPAWHPAFEGVRNRYSDRGRRRTSAVQRLCERLSIPGMDSLWDHLFEQEEPVEALVPRLREYFLGIRAESPEDGEESAREAFMRCCVEAALAEGGPVLVVCGGYHAPFLAEARVGPSAGFPEVPVEPSARSFLVPYSFRKLDAFTGYESGMPSPAFYQAVWEHGPRGAAEPMLAAAVRGIRGREQPLSAADLIATWTTAEGLARLRGHVSVTRADLLDGMAAALLKEGLEHPLPWTQRGPLPTDTHPLLAEVLRAFCGEQRGRLHEATPRPPLLEDVERTLHALGLEGAGRRQVRIDLRDARDLERSRTLHRLQVLRVSGVRKESGPSDPTEPVLAETWTVQRSEEQTAEVTEAAGYGATLEQAAAGRVEEALHQPGLGLPELAVLVSESLFAGLGQLTERVLAGVERQAGNEQDLARLGSALERLLGIFRHDVLLGSQGSATVGRIIAAIVERGLWLLEHVQGADQPANTGRILAVAALRDSVRYLGAGLGIDVQGANAVFVRRAQAAEAPPETRGACLGALWSLGAASGATVPGGNDESRILHAVRAMALPATFGDFLAGLFALAREEVSRSGALTSVLDSVVQGLTEEEFLRATPSLRLAFSFFPPREKAQLARVVARLHGGGEVTARSLLRLKHPPALVARGASLDAQVQQVLERFQLLSPEAPDAT